MVFPDCGSGTVVGAPIAALDEDGGFGIYGDKTRYATLQKKHRETTAANNTVSPASVTVASARGYETMRNLRTSIPSLVSPI